MKENQKQPLVSSKEEIIHNLIIVEQYLNGNSQEAKERMYKLIKRGRNFVAYKIEGEYHFAPSRFIGYQECNLDRHEENASKDGRETSQRLRRKSLLGTDVEDKKCENSLKRQCKEVGLELNKYRHTFWLLDENIQREVDAAKLDSEFPEGKIKEEKHKIHERNTAKIQQAKLEYLKKNGAVCQICGFDFKRKYGDVGADFIEAHHTKPVSEMKEGEKTNVKDLAFVCANCHRMLHRRRPWLTIENLGKLIKGK